MADRKLKVLMVNYEFPPIGGGGGTTTRFLAKSMTRLGVDVTVITARPVSEYFSIHPDGFKIDYVGPIKNKLSGTHIPELVRYALTLMYYSKAILERNKPDLLHCFFTLPSGSYGLFCKKFHNIPYLTSVLGADVPGFNIGDWRLDVYHYFTQFISRAIWNNSSYIVANSNSLKETCLEFSQNHDIKVITNGVDTDLFYPAKNKKINPDEIQLLFISRLMPQKGIDTLIKACGILKKREVNNFRLTVIGEGHLKGLMFSHIEEYNLKDKVNFLGWKDLDELPELYRNADIFILPSVMEGMPSVALQAMASGLPIITSKVKGFEALLEENINGLSAEYNNAEDFADKIERLIKYPKVIEIMSQKSYEKSKDFSWENIAKKYLELYNHSIKRTCEKSLVLK